jgi:hypothetical protein
MTCTSCHRWERIAYDVMISPGKTHGACMMKHLLTSFLRLLLAAVKPCLASSCQALFLWRLISAEINQKEENCVFKRVLGALGFQKRLSKECR